jgi:hypothetical protein
MEARDPKAARPRNAEPPRRRPPVVGSGLAPVPASGSSLGAAVSSAAGVHGICTAQRPGPVYARRDGGEAGRYASLPVNRSGFGLPNLRRNVCPHFYMTGSRGAIPIQAPHLLKALIRQEMNVSRCQLRGGVHLEQGYVNDVCLTPRFNQCVFYEDDLTKG